MKKGRQLGYATVRVLQTIDRGSRYGFDIIEQTGLPSGTVYPTLGRMEKRGFLEAHWEDRGVAEAEGRPRRRYYELTAQGRAAQMEAVRRFGMLASPMAEDIASVGDKT